MEKLVKYYLALVAVVLGAMGSGAMAQTFTTSVNGTTYDFTYFTGSYSGNISKFSTALMPWWGSFSGAQTFANAVAGNLGYPSSSYGPSFAYETGNSQDIYSFAFNSTNNTPAFDIKNVNNNTGIYAIATAVVPEIDGALIPQVGFLIGCLFLMLDRRKEIQS